MRRLYRILVNESNPKITVDPSSMYYNEFLVFEGTPKIPLSPKSAFLVDYEKKHPWQQILSIAPGAFAFSEEAWRECEEMYYLIELGSELISATNHSYHYVIVNALEIAPKADNDLYPCDLDSFSAPIFRIDGRDLSELYCLEGTLAPCNEFKKTYDIFGFMGLTFEEVWSGV